MQTPELKIVALQGSVRPGNNTAKALVAVARAAAALPGVSLEIIDPTELDLQLPGLGITADAEALQARVAEADAVILATPEYHGSYSSTFKLMIDNLGFPSMLKNKPVALLGVAAGRIGAIKALEHVRSLASHVGAIVLPGPVSIASVHKAFDDQGDLIDAGTAALIKQLVEGLVEYTRTHQCSLRPLENIARTS